MSNREEHRLAMKKVINSLNESFDRSEGNFLSALQLISTRESTMFVVGGDIDDLAHELSKALVHLIESDPKMLVSVLEAIMAGKERAERKKSGEEISDDTVGDDVLAIRRSGAVKELLASDEDRQRAKGVVDEFLNSLKQEGD